MSPKSTYSNERPTALPVQFQNIPQDLKAIPRWVLWRNVQRSKPDGTKVWAKLPISCSGQAASSTNPDTWSTYDDVADEMIMGTYDGIGLILGDDVQGIDLDDCRDPATGELTELAQEVLENVDGYAEVSPSGTGIKLFSKTNLDASRTKKEAGVELYRDGRYFTVTGHRINGHDALPMFEQDLGWFIRKVWAEELTPEVSGDAGERALMNYKGPLEGWDLDRVIDQVLPYLDPDCGYDEWLRIGQAMHHQGEGAEDWLAAWDDWSAGSGKWVEGYCQDKWDSFNQTRSQGRGVLTLATFIKQTKAKREAAVLNERDAAMDAVRDQIAACADARSLQEKIAASVANTPAFSDVEREQIAAAIQVKAKDLGVKLPIATVRGWVRGRSRQGNASMPDWAQPWVFVTEGDKFFNTDTKQEVTSQGFRAMFNRFMPTQPFTDQRVRADLCCTEQWCMPVVSHKCYMPGVNTIFEMLGQKWVNLYRPESVPEMPAAYSSEDLRAIDVVKQHLEVYLADQRERALLMSWIAWNVQHPGSKIRWSPYVHGVPGDGKSFFLELIGCAMGDQNVRALNGSTLESNFTDWAMGYAVVGVEEMKQHGHNRYDIMNRLKPFITNSQVEIHPKGKASYTAPNVSNYIIFSNYLDGAPVDEDDRRYMFLSSRMTTEESRRLTEEGYFKRLFTAVQEHAGAIRKWLLEFMLHAEFDANGRAPLTEIRSTVLELSKSDLQLTAECHLEEGGVGYCHDVVSTSHLTQAIQNSINLKPATSQVQSLMVRLGYKRAFKKQKKWMGRPSNIWIKSSLNWTESEIMARLDLTKGREFLA